MGLYDPLTAAMIGPECGKNVAWRQEHNIQSGIRGAKRPFDLGIMV